MKGPSLARTIRLGIEHAQSDPTAPMDLSAVFDSVSLRILLKTQISEAANRAMTPKRISSVGQMLIPSNSSKGSPAPCRLLSSIRSAERPAIRTTSRSPGWAVARACA